MTVTKIKRSSNQYEVQNQTEEMHGINNPIVGSKAKIHINEKKGKYQMPFDIFSMDDLEEMRPSIFSLQAFLLHRLSV